MDLEDEDTLTSEQVAEIYQYPPEIKHVTQLIERGSLPFPDIIQPKPRPKKQKYYWSVRHIKNNTKLPNEIIKLKDSK